MQANDNKLPQNNDGEKMPKNDERLSEESSDSFLRLIPVRTEHKILIWPRFYEKLFRVFLQRLARSDGGETLLVAVRGLHSAYETLLRRLGDEPCADVAIKDIEMQMDQLCGSVECSLASIRQVPSKFRGVIDIQHGRQMFPQAMAVSLRPSRTTHATSATMEIFPQYKIVFVLNSKHTADVDPLDIIALPTTTIEVKFGNAVNIAVDFRWKNRWLWRNAVSSKLSHQ